MPTFVIIFTDAECEREKLPYCTSIIGKIEAEDNEAARKKFATMLEKLEIPPGEMPPNLEFLIDYRFVGHFSIHPITEVTAKRPGKELRKVKKILGRPKLKPLRKKRK